jgi:hypothetical protein
MEHTKGILSWKQLLGRYLRIKHWRQARNYMRHEAYFFIVTGYRLFRKREDDFPAWA